MANHFDRHYCGKCGLTYVYQKAEAWEREREISCFHFLVMDFVFVQILSISV
jgi:hypothetical protein